MKRSSRTFLNATTLLSALMLTATIGMWVRAQYACDTVSHLWISRMDGEIEDRRVGAMGMRGSLVLIWMQRTYRPDNVAATAVVRRVLPTEMGFDHERLLPQHNWPARGLLRAAGFGWIGSSSASQAGRNQDGEYAHHLRASYANDPGSVVVLDAALGDRPGPGFVATTHAPNGVWVRDMRIRPSRNARALSRVRNGHGDRAENLRQL